MQDLPKAPVPAAILEAAIYVDDLPAAEAFYGGIIGLEMIQKVGNRHIFYRVGPAVLLIFNPEESALPPGNPALPVPPHGARGPGHVCLTLDRQGLAEMRLRLLTAGFEIEAEFDWPHGPSSLYTRDPAGNSVEFAEPTLWN